MKSKMRLASVVVCLILAVISLAIFITVNSVWLFQINIGPLHLVADTGVSKVKLIDEYKNIIWYLQNPVQHGELQLSYFASSVDGIKHFADVRNLITVNNIVMIITVPTVLYQLDQFKKNSQIWMLLNPIRIGEVVLMVLGVVLFFNFNQVFIGFHELLFRNDYWIFDPNKDPVINMLPDTFFFECFLLFIGISVALLATVHIWTIRKIKTDQK
ncbi:TIGR01906 family membrane protein [Lentilactobacillus sp. Marseille-Q4993]|uniref:TIGR01906 family membrane protein n=1 Tax=Lentilactobacillus sp. Marseille-Q4993 TaxID=3039492 RepID=UPI0024BC0F58|nr:TIGR01906 family membrane protein [Lentilactobacillus sp. Marseille-Q4993]